MSDHPDSPHAAPPAPEAPPAEQPRSASEPDAAAAPVPAPAPPHPDEHFEEGEEARPRGVRAMAVVRWIMLLAMAAAAVFTVYGYAQGQNADEPKYYCPMHPKVTSPTPGECPICHMTLEPIPEDRKGGALPTASASSTATLPGPAGSGSTARPHIHDGARFTCPMHPEIRSKEPGRCPICKMDLVPIEGETLYTCPMHPDVKSHEPGSCPICHMDLVSETPNQPPTPPAGTAPITLTLDQVQAIGVRTALVDRREPKESRRFVATVEVPDEGRAEVHVRSEGYIEAIRVRELGVQVKAGDLLAAYYSPEIYQAQQELVAMKDWPSAGGYAPPTEAARRRLELLGLGRATIERIATSGAVMRDIAITSPIAGHVIGKNIVLGSRVMPETVLFEIADLTRIYVIASVYADMLGSIHVGDVARFSKTSSPDRVYQAKVDLLYPEVDTVTRTSRVRFKVDNTDLSLKPGDFGTAELEGQPMEGVLTVPLDAVIDTGREAYVFLALDAGRFEPRRVALGGELGDRFIVQSGVAEGDRVVSGAAFLIDAESRLQASFAGEVSSEAGVPAKVDACEADFDRHRYPEKYERCVGCQAHRTMGAMYDDCLQQIAKPWR